MDLLIFYASSFKLNLCEVPTDEKVPLSIDDISNPRWSYAVSKIFGECALNSYGKKYPLNYNIVRFHNVYGPRMGNIYM